MTAPHGDGDGAWVLGVDSGGSGLRVALARTSPEGPGAGPAGHPEVVGTLSSGDAVRTGPSGIDPRHMAAELIPAVRTLLDRAAPTSPGAPATAPRNATTPRAADAPRIAAVCIGAAGMATLGDGLRTELPGILSEAFGVPSGGRRIALVADAVTAYAGALGERPGAVVAAGTGMIAMGTDLRRWSRSDGWGHLLGDCGGGAWVGRAGLEAAMRAYDGRTGGSAALRARAEKMFGVPLSGLPAQLYPREDRPAVLASFAPEVALCAAGEDGDGPDPVAVAVLRAAASEIALSAAAVCPEEPGGAQGAAGGAAARVALTGGLFRVGETLTVPVREELAARLPGATVVEAAGDPLDGAVLIAARIAAGGLALPPDPALLHLV